MQGIRTIHFIILVACRSATGHSTRLDFEAVLGDLVYAQTRMEYF